MLVHPCEPLVDGGSMQDIGITPTLITLTPVTPKSITPTMPITPTPITARSLACRYSRCRGVRPYSGYVVGIGP